MCLIALALDQHPRFPLVIAANRDEFLHRPAATLDWWRPAPGAAPLLGGRDLQAGGTWMGLSATGRVALLTNLRDPTRLRTAAPSRGAIVPAWLATPQPADEFWRDTLARGCNPFNLLAADLRAGTWWWADDRAATPRVLGPGLYGLSNALLDTPWPKVQGLKRALREALDSAASAMALEVALFAALADRTPVADAALPDTGIGLDRERWLAPAFIRTPDASYGTRCSTLLIAERSSEGMSPSGRPKGEYRRAKPEGTLMSAQLVERQFDADGRALSQRRVRLARWPLLDGVTAAVEGAALNPA